MSRPRGSVSSPRSRQIVELFQAGMSRPEICRATGASRQAVHEVLKTQRPEWIDSAPRSTTLDKLVRQAEALAAGIKGLRDAK